MIKLLLKGGMYIAIVGVAGYFAVNNVPSLRANIVEYVNPRVKEARLLNEVQSTLETAVSAAGTPATRQEAVAKAKTIIAQIEKINDSNDGIVPTIMQKAVDVISTGTALLPTSITDHLPAALVSSPAASSPSGSSVASSASATTSPLAPCATK